MNEGLEEEEEYKIAISSIDANHGPFHAVNETLPCTWGTWTTHRGMPFVQHRQDEGFVVWIIPSSRSHVQGDVNQ